MSLVFPRPSPRKAPPSVADDNASLMLTPRFLYHRSRSRLIVGTALLLTALSPRASNARATLTLALAALGLIDVVDRVSVPWRSLIASAVLALLAFSFFFAAKHSQDNRTGWLLSGSVATGLAIADSYNLINAMPAAPAAGAFVSIAIILAVVRSATQQRPRR
jgi:hypothetical protein